MRLHFLLLSALLGSAGLAQTPAPLPTGRHCKPHTLDTRWVTFGEIGDTVALITALRDAADTGEAVTSATVDYKQDGRIARVHVSGVMSNRAGKDLETEFRTHLSQLGSLPKHFSIMVARLNAMNYVDLLPSLVTCPPERLPTAKSDSVLKGISRLYEMGRLNRFGWPVETTAQIGIWVEPSGDVRATWIQESSGSSVLDSLALETALASRFLPPLVGSRAAPALLGVPIQFRMSSRR